MSMARRATYDELMAIMDDSAIHELVHGRIAGDGVLDAGPVLPGFVVSPAELFDR